MKKLMIMTALAAVFGFAANAQKTDAAKVPAAVKAAFAKQYPGAVAKWEKEEGKYEAGFKQNGNTMSALFEANGTMIESEMDIKETDLPATVLAYVKEHYNGKKIKEGAKITKADGTVNYEAEVAGKDVIFDAKGKFLKEVKE
jgi:Putative beta-lactamase-inhibitor-like, PepSY-like